MEEDKNAQVQLNPKSNVESSQEEILKSINVLIQSVIKAQNSGAYTLQEASIIFEAIKILQNTFNKKE